MVGPEAIIQQVWQKIVPTDWKIIHGRRRSALAVGIATSIWTCLLTVLLVLLAVVIRDSAFSSQPGRPSRMSIAGLSSATLAGYPALAVVAAAALALALLAGVIATVIVARRHADDPDPVLVLLPQGFVEFVSQRKPIIGILYAELATVDFRLRSTKYAQRSQPGVHPQTTHTRIWLDLHYHDGHRERWRPRAGFGPPEQIFQTIIKAHALYEVLYGSER